MSQQTLSSAQSPMTRAGHLPMSEIIDRYMADYTGRDMTRATRLAFWTREVGSVPLQELTDDHVHDALERLASGPSRYFAGKDADGQPIHRARRKPPSGSTLNRYQAALGAVITWAIKKRIAPRGYVHPVRTVERHEEGDHKTRFLSADEQTRLLAACKGSSWPRLYALVLMALTTGARHGELMGLRWRDVDLDAATAVIERSKNNDSKGLTLTAPAVEALRPFKGKADAYVFTSERRPGQPMSMRKHFDAAMRVAGIRGATFHTLRHTCASSLAKDGATLLEIADVLGHRRLEVTRRYSHLTTGHKAKLVNRVLGDLK